MKKIILTLLTLGVAGLPIIAQDPPGNNNPPPPPPNVAGDNMPGGPEAGSAPPQPSPEMIAAIAAALTNEVVQAQAETIAAANTNDPGKKAVSEPPIILPGQSKAVASEIAQTSFIPPTQPSGTNNPNDIQLNFRNAPLEMVLNYLSDAAGLIIVLDTRISGNVTIKGSHLTRDEAVDLLNSVLNKNNYAAMRNGRTLTIVDKNDAKTRDIPVKTGNDPEEIPKNAEIVTQIIPIRFVEARQLVSDLTSFVSPQATVVANEAGNSIVITDTQQNIRHLTEIIKAIDSSAQSETEIRVFRLKYASPIDVASELASIFPSSTSGSTAQAPTRFAGGGGGGGFFQRMASAASAATAGGGANDRVKKAMQVNVVPDARIQAVIVTAPKDLMDQIADMMTDLDVPSTRDQKVFVFQMKNADPQQAAQVLQNMFQSSGSTRTGSGSSQNSPLMQRAQNNTTSSSSSGSTSGLGSTGGGRGGAAGGLQF